MNRSLFVFFGLLFPLLTSCGQGRFFSVSLANSTDSPKSGSPEGQREELSQPNIEQIQADTVVQSPQQNDSISIKDEPLNSELDDLLSGENEDIIRSRGNKGLVAGCMPTHSVSISTVPFSSFSFAPETALNFGWGAVNPPAQTTTIKNETFELGHCVASELKTEKLALCELSTSKKTPLECKKWSEVAGVGQKDNHTACKQKADANSGITSDRFGQRSSPNGESFFVCQKVN